VLEQLERSLAQRNISTSRTGNARQYNHVFDQFSAEFDRRWPKTHAANFYTHLLSNEADLDEAADETGIEAPTLLTDGAELRMEDIPPLAYLSYLIDGAIPMYPPGEPETVWTSLDHAVIDEAQDLAPLALKLIRAHAHGLTVLGDMNQTVYSHRGTRSWQEVMDALGSEAGQIRVLGASYRSTLPITDLANSVVRNGRLKGGESQPFARVGPPPTLRAAKHEAELLGTVTQFVVQAIEDGSKTVAVLTRTAARARSLQNEMKDQLPAPSICVTDRQDDRDAPIVVMPAYLAKGIEFDTVAVVDVDATTYTQVQNDAAVLYVAITRALNNLLLVWVGAPSSLIAARDAEDRIKNVG
jgi:DNA helicase-2/ATP-dependent DNA helicase PcrA